MARMNRLLVGLALIATVALGACGPTGSAASPTSPAGSASLGVAATPSAAVHSAVTDAGQTDTPWGRIWDMLPAGFPAIPGSTPTDATDGPASAVFVVQGAAAKSIATAMQAALSATGFRTEGLSGPLEDGSYVLDMAGTPVGCRTQVAAKPLGRVTTVTVMYGAACPGG